MGDPNDLTSDDLAAARAALGVDWSLTPLVTATTWAQCPDCAGLFRVPAPTTRLLVARCPDCDAEVGVEAAEVTRG